MKPAKQNKRTVQDVLAMFRERLWLFLGTWVAILLGFVLYQLLSTPLYESAASVQVNTPANSQRTAGVSGQGADSVVALQLGRLQSAQAIEATAEALQESGAAQAVLAPYVGALRFNSAPLTLVDVVTSARTVQLSTPTLVHVAFRHPSPELAHTLTNTFINTFLKREEVANMAKALQTVDALRREAGAQQIKIEAIMGQVEGLEAAQGIASFPAQEAAEAELLAGAEQNVEVASRALNEAKSRWDRLETAHNEGQPLWNLTFIANDSQVNTLLTQLAESEINLTQLGERYRSKHPKMRSAQATHQSIQQALQAALTAAAERVRSDYMSAQATLQSTLSAQEELRTRSKNMQAPRKAYAALAQELQLERSVYTGLTQRIEAAALAAQVPPSAVRLLDAPSRPTAASPASPNAVFNLLMGIFGGLGVATLLVLFVAWLDDRVKTTHQVENVLGLNFIGLVPTVKGSPDSFAKARIAATGDDFRVSEAFRGIHAGIKLAEQAADKAAGKTEGAAASEAGENKRGKILALTSTTPSEGKSFVSTNLAYTFAYHGEKTLLIDADLRVPTVARSLGLEDKAQGGLVEYFEGDANWETIIAHGALESLDVLPSGRKARKPSEIIASQHFGEILTVLSAHYDRIVIDTPPIGAVSDCLNILPQVDSLLYVMKYGHVRMRAARQALARVNASGVHVAGAVMNQVSRSGTAYYAAYYDKSYEDYYLKAE